MARTVVRADADRVKAEVNRDPKVRDKDAVRVKDKHGHKVQENPRGPARAEARVRVNPQHRVQLDSREQVAMPLRAQPTHPDTCNSPWAAACHRRCIVQVAEVAK